MTLQPVETSASSLPEGALVTFDPSVQRIGRELLAGGHPWRLWRLSGSTLSVADRWTTPTPVAPSHQALVRSLLRAGILRMERTRSATGPALTTVVIPCYRDVAGLARVLGAFRETRCIVVDDASPNGAEVAACAAHYGATLLRLEHNQGPAAARNAGARAVMTPFALFLDSDVLLTDGDRLVAELVGACADAEVGAVAPRVRGTGPGRRGAFEQSYGPLDLGGASALVRPGGAVSYVPSAVLLVRVDAFGAGFDESLRTGEDVDFVWRLHDAGWLIRYEADLEVQHIVRPTARAWWHQRVGYGQSAAALAERHPGRVVPVQADATTASVWLAVLFGKFVLVGPLLRLAIRGMASQLPATLDDRPTAAQAIVTTGIRHAGRPLARSVVRSFLPLVLCALLSRRTRRTAAVVLVAGTMARFPSWRSVRASDALYGVADDAAYATGLWRGAWRARTLDVLTPRLTWRTAGLALRRAPRDER
jgi:mycofactocin glycosyltransferase